MLSVQPLPLDDVMTDSKPKTGEIPTNSKWDWFWAYGAALLVGGTCFCVLVVVAEVIQTPSYLPNALEGLGPLFGFTMVFSVPIWLIGWPLAFGLRYLAGRLFGERLIASVLAGCVAGIAIGWLIFGWAFRLHFPESVAEIVIAVLAGAAGGVTWWGIEQWRRQSRVENAAREA